MNKGISNIVGVIIVAVILIGGIGGYMYLKNKQIEPVACTMDAKQCPDGSAVGRIAPNCEFAECPVVASTSTPTITPTSTIVCTMDAKQCSDGSYVSRIPPKCEFAKCPIIKPTSTITSTTKLPTTTIKKPKITTSTSTPIKTTQDLSTCDKIIEVWDKDVCYNKIAKNERDLSICDKIQTQSQKDICYMNIAESTQNVSLCDKILKNIDVKDSCYLYIARIKKDASICDKLQYGKTSCYREIDPTSYFSKLETSCANTENIDDRGLCYTILALDKNDFSMCKKISDDLGIYTCYTFIAKGLKDSSICDNITDQIIKNKCYTQVVGK